MKTKSFDGATHVEAKQRLNDWIKSQTAIKIIETNTTTVGADAKRGQPIREPDSWTITIKYEGGGPN